MFNVSTRPFPHLVKDLWQINVLSICLSGGQNVKPYAPEYKVNKPFLQLSIFRKGPKQKMFHFVCSFKVTHSFSDDEL